MLKRRVIYVVILLTYIVSENVLDLFQLNYEINDIIFVIGLLLASSSPNRFLQYLKENTEIAIIFIFLFVSNILMSYINYQQPLIYSVYAGRFLISYIFLGFVVWLYSKTIREYDYLSVFIPVIIIAINYYAYISKDMHIFRSSFHVSERNEDVRFLAAGTSVLYFMFYYFNRITLKPFYFILFILLFCIIIIVSKTRGLIIPATLVLLFTFFDKFRIYRKRKVLIYSILVVFVLIVFGGTMLTGVSNAYNSVVSEYNSIDSNNTTIRIEEYKYFYNLLIDSPISLFFGYGVDNEYTKGLFPENYFLSDIGIFKIVFYHGLIGLFSILYLFNKLIRYCNRNTHSSNIFNNDVKSFILFQLFSAITVTFFYKTPAVIFFMILFFVSKRMKYEKY